MIDAKTLRLITQNGLQAFAQGRILDGIAALKSLLPYCTHEAVISADAESLEKNYHYMLSFLRGGGDDEKRNEVQTKIQRSGISLIEQTGRKIRLHLNDDRYSEAFNRLQSTYSEPMSVLFEKWDSLLTPEERSDIQDDLFDLLWTSGFWTPQDLAFWYGFITEQHDMVQQHLTGALFLSIWEHYDGEKMQLLCLMAENECRRTHITAVAYLLLLRLRHKEVTALMPTLPECCLSRKKRLVADTCYEMLLMLLSEKDMKQELEEAERLSQELFSSKNSLNTSNIKAIVTLKARYMRNRLQRGLDPNLAKAPLLHSCEYLRRIAHWFLPFDKNHPLFQSVMIDEKGNEKQKLSTLVDFILDCDVDKLAMLYLVANDKDFSKAALQLDKQELPDLENAAVPEYSLRFVIQDLFRFFVHSPLSSQLINPFREKLTLFDFPELANLIPANESIACCELLLELEQPRQAIAVLNVLDTDYYFRLVDAALAQNVSAALLLLNEVLVKGFDAGNFVTGFAQHLRDVLVSKDAATAQLLETSDAIRQHYQEQAKRCQAKWLFNALDVMNTCDIQYRTAKNKRLTVELSLVKLCRLLEPVETPVAQPVQKPAPAAQPAPKAPAAAPAAAAEAPAKPKAASRAKIDVEVDE